MTAFGAANDTTVNPLKPSPPTGLTVAPGAGSGELVVSWPSAASATAGYRLYRSTAAFVSGSAHRRLAADRWRGDARPHKRPIRQAHGPTGAWRAARQYHYAVASVNCDETLVAGYHYNSNAALSDYAVASVTPPATPRRRRRPPRWSHGGQRRALLTLTNPLAAASADFDRTEIYWNKGAPPHLDGTVVSDGTHLPDSDSGSPGVFRNRGSQVIVFDSETVASPALPSLVAGATYNFLAVSYDRCGNPSPSGVLVLGIPAGTCADNPPGAPVLLFFRAPVFFVPAGRRGYRVGVPGNRTRSRTSPGFVSRGS